MHVLGFRLNENGRCICATDRNFILDSQGNCVCPQGQGYEIRNGICEPIPPGCESDSDCPSDRFCYKTNGTCINPCTLKVCGTNAYCTPLDHQAICVCPEGLPANPSPNVFCGGRSKFMTLYIEKS